jgi:hypothetical protein
MIPIWLTGVIALAALLAGIVGTLVVALLAQVALIGGNDIDDDAPELPVDFDEAYWRETEQRIQPLQEYRGYA